MKLYHVPILLAVAAAALWSWVLTDPNFTLFPHAYWTSFRETMVMFGLYNRPASSAVFVGLIVLLTALHLYFVYRKKEINRLFVILIALIAGFASYNALSHDFFNYIFDAKILTVYHQNPYLVRAMDFPADESLRFMHWIHRTYPYGPTYLVITVIPSFLGFGKFLPTLLLFRLLSVGSYLGSVYALAKMNRRAAVLFATSPLVIIEGLMNGHNDFIAVGIAIGGIYLLYRQRKIWGRVVLLLSAGIKFITLPTIILDSDIKKSSWRTYVAFAGVLAMAGYASWKQEIQPWYFLNLFIFLPYLYGWVKNLWPFFTALLLSYYPYVAGGEWGQGGDVNMKHQIMWVGAIVNVVWVVAIWVYARPRQSLTSEAKV